MGIPNSELLSIIGRTQQSLVLDPQGVAGSGVFTDYAACIAAAAALDGLVTVFVRNDVTVSTGSFGPEMSRITFRGTISVPTILFDGDATHSSLPKSLQFVKLEVASSATAVPFLPTDEAVSFIDMQVATLTTQSGSGPLIRYSSAGVLIVSMDATVLSPDSETDPIIDLAIAGSSVEITIVPATVASVSGAMSAQSYAAVAAASISILHGGVDENIQHPREGAAVDASANVAYVSAGPNGGVNSQFATDTDTHRRMNTRWSLDTTGGPYTITLDITETTLRAGNWIEFLTDSTNDANPVTLSLVGATFTDGSTSRVLQSKDGYWRLVSRPGDTFDLLTDVEGINTVAITANDLDVDLSVLRHIKVLLDANVTSMTVLDPLSVGLVTIEITQAAASAFTVAWDDVFNFAGGTAPTMTATFDAVDMHTFFWNGTVYQPISIQQDVS